MLPTNPGIVTHMPQNHNKNVTNIRRPRFRPLISSLPLDPFSWVPPMSYPPEFPYSRVPSPSSPHWFRPSVLPWVPFPLWVRFPLGPRPGSTPGWSPPGLPTLRCKRCMVRMFGARLLDGDSMDGSNIGLVIALIGLRLDRCSFKSSQTHFFNHQFFGERGWVR